MSKPIPADPAAYHVVYTDDHQRVRLIRRVDLSAVGEYDTRAEAIEAAEKDAAPLSD